MKKLMFATIAAALTVSPAMADQVVPASETVTLKVSTDGLNLANPRDVAQLQSRVEKAIATACTPQGVYRAYQVADSACTGKMATDTQQVVASMTRDAAKSQMAEF